MPVMMYICYHMKVPFLKRLLEFKFNQAYSWFHIYIAKCSEQVVSFYTVPEDMQIFLLCYF